MSKDDTELDTIIDSATKAVTAYTDTDALGNTANITDFDQILIDRPTLRAALLSWREAEVRRAQQQLQADIKRLPTVDSSGWWVSKEDINKLFAELEAGSGEAVQ